MKKYKLIVSDLDGTLLNKKMETGEKNDAAIAEMVRRGITFVPSSGRTYHQIPNCVLENPDIRYVTYSNGTAIFDKKENRIILSNEISEEDSKRIVEIAKKYRVYTVVHFDGYSHVPAIFGKKNMEYYKINEYYQAMLVNEATYDDLSVLEKREGGTESFVLFFHDDSELSKCVEELSKIDGISVTSSVAHNIEIVSARAGKGFALRAFADMLGIKKEEIIVIGDSANDISMFEEAGLSLCAESESEEAKRNADRVICSCEEGVADYVLKNIL